MFQSSTSPCLQTKRLTLAPMPPDAVRVLIERARVSDPELAQAYTEMLDGALAHPESALWYLPWRFSLRGGDTMIGDACFKGFPESGAPEVGYGLDADYRNRGYATEGVAALCRWALAQPGVTGIEAETAPDNAASQRVLEKLGFQPTGATGEEGPRFHLKKQSEV